MQDPTSTDSSRSWWAHNWEFSSFPRDRVNGKKYEMIPCFYGGKLDNWFDKKANLARSEQNILGTISL